ncbi:hypothetical protein LCGC14_0879720 [marine sediment metagenome]|uniref:FHA domain-containing protein n=1 Tax=marine sediment metagenome TaxID=412755 RepID=A0A0F9PMY7_9ZZZZ
MGLLKKIEKKLENAVEGLFAKGFKSKVEPVELGKKMALAMMNNKVVALKKSWAPNEFEITLSKEDEAEYSSYQKGIVHELQDFLVQEATAEGLSMMGRPKIKFIKDEKLVRGQFRIEVKMSDEFVKEIEDTNDGATQMIPLEVLEQQKTKHILRLEPAGIQHNLKEGRNLIGRSNTNDIAIGDPSLSRQHLEIYLENEEAILNDLNSTNGTSINGQEVKSQILKPDDEIVAGSVTLFYRRTND